MLLLHKIEVILRQAKQRNQPVSSHDIWQSPDISESAPKEYHVRDRVRAMVAKGLVVKVPIAESQSGNKRSSVGYMWANLEKSIDSEGLRSTRKGTDVPIEPVQPVVSLDRDVELVVSGVTVVVGRNPATGRIRITIE